MTAVDTAPAATCRGHGPAGPRRAGALRRARLLLGLAIVGFFVLLALIGPYLVANPDARSAAPSPGRRRPRTGWAPRSRPGRLRPTRGQRPGSLLIGAGAGLIATAISVVIGIGGGFLGGWSPTSRCRCSNVLLVIPGLPLIIVITADVKATGLLPLILDHRVHQLGRLRPGAARADPVAAQPRLRAGRPGLGRAALADRAGGDRAQRAADHRLAVHLRHDLRHPHPGRPGVPRPRRIPASSPGATCSTSRRTRRPSPAAPGGGSSRRGCASPCSAPACP